MNLSVMWKRRMARAVRWRPLQWAMNLGIRALVARHRVGVALVPMDGEGRILMLHHVFHPYVPWGLPGGWMNRKESPAQCALRELREETGLVARLGPVVHVVGQSVPAAHMNLSYVGHLEPAPVTLSAEVLEARWFTPDALPDPLLPFTRDSIAAAVTWRRQQLALAAGGRIPAGQNGTHVGEQEGV